jgi:hypothetical protein
MQQPTLKVYTVRVAYIYIKNINKGNQGVGCHKALSKAPPPPTLPL